MTPRYKTGSTSSLRFMQPQEFEEEAIQLIAEYGNKHGVVAGPPVPGQSHLLLALKAIEKQALFANSWNADRSHIARINTFLSF